MNCPNCGEPGEPGAAFCSECGTALPQPVEPPPQPAPAVVQGEPARGRSPMFIAGVVIAVALLILCCCCAIVGGGMLLSGYLSAPPTAPTPTRISAVPTAAPLPTAATLPKPTEAPPPTEAPLPTKAPPTPVSPVAKTPSIGPATSSETTKTYERTELGFSIEYPDNWEIEKEQENSVTFIHPTQQLRTFVLVGQNTSWASGEAYNATFVDLMKQSGTVQDLSTSEMDFAGASWALTVFNLEKTTGTTRNFVVATVYKGDLYVILNYGDIDVFLSETRAMSKMNVSIRFLSRPNTPTPTKSAAAATYRATVEVKASGGQPFIRGRVTNRSGSGVSGALVELYNGEKQWLNTVGTGTDGRYELTVSAGVYYMRLKDHRSDWSPLITVKWGQEATVDWKEQ